MDLNANLFLDARYSPESFDLYTVVNFPPPLALPVTEYATDGWWWEQPVVRRSKDGDRPYACDLCEKAYKNPQNLRRHQTLKRHRYCDLQINYY